MICYGKLVLVIRKSAFGMEQSYEKVSIYNTINNYYFHFQIEEVEAFLVCIRYK